ncbi:hypothetical protein B0H13DRAFT_2345983 [Mycena leptocephala]|nr:hypothetical protein B0H13DRAFT_2345983 [Mycena leptocephala]
MSTVYGECPEVPIWAYVWAPPQVWAPPHLISATTFIGIARELTSEGYSGYDIQSSTMRIPWNPHPRGPGREGVLHPQAPKTFQASRELSRAARGEGPWYLYCMEQPKESTLLLDLRLRGVMQIFGKLTAEHHCSQFARSTVNAGASFSTWCVLQEKPTVNGIFTAGGLSLVPVLPLVAKHHRRRLDPEMDNAFRETMEPRCGHLARRSITTTPASTTYLREDPHRQDHHAPTQHTLWLQRRMTCVHLRTFRSPANSLRKISARTAPLSCHNHQLCVRHTAFARLGHTSAYVFPLRLARARVPTAPTCAAEIPRSCAHLAITVLQTNLWHARDSTRPPALARAGNLEKSELRTRAQTRTRTEVEAEGRGYGKVREHKAGHQAL